MKNTTLLTKLAGVTLALIPATQALGVTSSQIYGEALDKSTPTVFINSDAGYSTYESQLAKSNTTGVVTRFTVGAYAGEARRFGVFLRATDSKLDFKLNKSTASYAKRDIFAQARFGYLLASAVYSFNETKVSRETTKMMDSFSAGMGGSLAVQYPFMHISSLHADATVVRTPSSTDKLGNTLGEQTRIELEGGTYVKVIKDLLDLTLGYTYNRYDLKVNKEAFDERQSAPYAGLRIGSYF